MNKKLSAKTNIHLLNIIIALVSYKIILKITKYVLIQKHH